MRLLNSKSKQLELLHGRLPRYAILSHRWGAESEEVLFIDIGDQCRTQSKGRGYEKMLGCCAQAIQDELDYVWMDTCCIDKRNSTELTEALNSMYKWYQKSEVCYAYLYDVSDLAEFSGSEWFLRGWTLQELIAPRLLKFFAKDWSFIGTREDLMDRITERTGISSEILQSGVIPPEVSIAQRMSWAAKRETTKVEDKAYSLLGVLGINMPTVYGIEHAAFEELQHRIIAKSADQTLFAWYHCIIQPVDAEMADPDGDAGDTSPSNTTGLLASSPSQYLNAYEIHETDFRKNFVDRIRDRGYRSHFSITNNFVHISLPIKHIEGKIWKAVLRCSFDPPSDDQIQRPLVIYLEETQPWQYIRTHIPVSQEKYGDDQTNVVEGFSGSLERLSDAEANLDGYFLVDVDVVGRHGESSPVDPSRPSSGDPDSSTELTEAERIAKLSQHPPGARTTNIVVCGEPGVGAGRVINQILGDTVIKPLTDFDRDIMAVTPIDTTLQSKNIRIFYITGPKDPYLSVEGYRTSLQNMYRLVQYVKEAGGIHLVLLCVVGSKVTATVECNYRLFHNCVGNKQVPMALVVTGLGKMRRMEDWWDKHRSNRDLQAMCFIDHACITVLQGEDEEHEKKYGDSTQTIHRLLIEFISRLETTPKVYRPENMDRWFGLMGKQSMCLLLPSQKKSLTQEAVAKALKEGCSLSEVDASDLAGQFFLNDQEIES